MDAFDSNVWLQAIKEVRQEEGLPPISPEEANEVRADCERMKAARLNQRETAKESVA
jgi:hypothetical protein